MLHAAGQRACSLENPAAGSGTPAGAAPMESLPHRVRTPASMLRRLVTPLLAIPAIHTSTSQPSLHKAQAWLESLSM